MNAKQGKHHRPQIKSKGAMDKEVVYLFLISVTQMTPIQNQHLLFPKIINGQNFPQSCSPGKKKSNSRWDLRLPHQHIIDFFGKSI